MQNRELLEKLLSAESEQAVDRVIASSPEMSDEDNWMAYGGVDNNFGVIANQQSDSLAALVEKTVNSTDALMVRRALELEIDPTSDDAPNSLSEAAEEFFGVPNGALSNIKDHDRRRALADNVYVVAEGARSTPTIAIVDRGEGQTPEEFPNTFLSLQASNKLKIPFVQGRFNMGGTGALPFAGRKGYQLILSRRHPSIAGRGPDNEWGWTLVKRRPPREGERSPSYVFFAPDFQIPSFEGGPLPLLPEGASPRAKMLDGGTYIKLYDYKLSPATIITASLYRRLNLKLFYVPVPITLHECRDYKAKTRYTFLEGQRNRLEDVRFRSDVIERPDFPIESTVQIQKGENVRVKAWLLKSGVDASRWTRPSESICLTVNGQTHATYDRRFFSRDRVQKDYVKNDLLVEVDCSDLSTGLISDIFMASRDRIRDIRETKDMERALEKLFKDDPILKEYDRIRREEKLKEKLDETRSATEILKGFMKVSPEIAALLGGGNILPSPKGVDKEEPLRPFLGEEFPTHLTLRKPDSGLLQIPQGCRRQIIFETDVENSYLSRPYNPGVLEVCEDDDWVRTRSLRNGQLSLTVQPPENAKVGEELEIEVRLSSPNAGGSGFFERKIAVEIVEEPEENDRDDNNNERDPKKGLELPLISGVRQHEWDMFDWNEDSVASVHNHEGGTDIYVNLDNKHLRATLRERSHAGNEAQIENMFKIGIGLIAFGIKSKIENVEDAAQDKILSTVAGIWLPSILKLKSIL